MKGKAFKIFVFATALTFFGGSLHLPVALASSVLSSKVDVEIMVKVSQKGFADERGKLFSPKNFLKIPKGQVVRITFVFDENMSSLSYGDTHQIAITGAGGTKESEKIWVFSQKSSITLQSGKDGDAFRAYCIVDCIGMEHLNNLLIKVV